MKRSLIAEFVLIAAGFAVVPALAQIETNSRRIVLTRQVTPPVNASAYDPSAPARERAAIDQTNARIDAQLPVDYERSAKAIREAEARVADAADRPTTPSSGKSQ